MVCGPVHGWHHPQHPDRQEQGPLCVHAGSGRTAASPIPCCTSSWRRSHRGHGCNTWTLCSGLVRYRCGGVPQPALQHGLQRLHATGRSFPGTRGRRQAEGQRHLAFEPHGSAQDMRTTVATSTISRTSLIMSSKALVLKKVSKTKWRKPIFISYLRILPRLHLSKLVIYKPGFWQRKKLYRTSSNNLSTSVC